MKILIFSVVVMAYIGGGLGAAHAILASSCTKSRGNFEVGFVAMFTAAVWPVFAMAEVVSSVAGHRMPICNEDGAA